jgi:PAS domain S-box-containing protein
MKSKTTHILLVEDSETHAAIICEALESAPNPVKLTVVQSLAEARFRLSESLPDLAIIDLLLPDGKGTELLPDAPEEASYPAVIMTSHGDEQAAVEAMKAGVLDYVVKSATTLADIPHLVERVLREWTQIAERRRAEEALEESEERFRSFFESVASGMAILSPEGRALQVNPTLCRVSGYCEAKALEKDFFEITYPDDREETQRIFAEIRSGRRKVIDYEQRFLCKDGLVIWGRVTVAGVYGSNGALSYFATNVQDITEYKRAQDQIRKSQQMLQLVLDYIPQHVFWKDQDSVYRGCNRNFASAAGFENPRDIIGKTDYDLAWKREEADFYRECDVRVMEANAPELHIIEPQLQASGKQAWLDTNKIPLHDDKGGVVGILGTFDDITERKLAEEALIEANRELDAFVYTVSHDLRTPLTPIIGYAEVLQETCRDRLDEQSLGYLAEIEGQGRRMVALMEDLLALAKVGQVERPTESVDLNALVENVLVDMGSLIAGAGVAVEKNPLPGMRIPKTLLTQVFDNLIGNAIRYAGREGSPIEVGGERRGDLVRLYVRDHGPGIPKEERSRIFEVFYRGATGKKSPGTGVGLATVLKIARLFGGCAWVEETEGGGCTFWVEMLDVSAASGNEVGLP